MTSPRAHFATILFAFSLASAGRLRGQDTTTTRLPASGPITLAEAIWMAIAGNTVVRLAQNAAVLDSITVREFRNQFLPNLSGSSQTSQALISGAGGNPFATSLGISSGVTLYNGGQNVNSLREAESLMLAGGNDLTRTKQTEVFIVASDFLNLVTQQEQARVQQENLTAQLQELAQLQAFTTAGTHPIGDLYQEQAAVAATRLALSNATYGTELAKVQLIQELVLDPRATYTFVAPTPRDSTAPLPTFNLDSLIAVALVQRADVQAQQLRVDAAKREILVAEGGRLPVISATGGFSSGYSAADDGSFATQLNQRRGGSLGVDVSIPILDRGAVSIARERAQIQLETETLALRDLDQTVALQIRRALLDYQATQELVTESDAQQTASALALQAAQALYRNGESTFIEVTLARATLVQARSAQVDARSTLAFDRAVMSYYTGLLGPANARVDR